MTTCLICSGAIPEGQEPDGHTALCAGVVGERLGKLVAAAKLVQRDLKAQSGAVSITAEAELDDALIFATG